MSTAPQAPAPGPAGPAGPAGAGAGVRRRPAGGLLLLQGGRRWAGAPRTLAAAQSGSVTTTGRCWTSSPCPTPSSTCRRTQGRRGGHSRASHLTYRFFSGDWASLEGLLSSELKEEEEKFDLILTSETIYNVDNQPKLISIFKKLLKRDGEVTLSHCHIVLSRPWWLPRPCTLVWVGVCTSSSRLCGRRGWRWRRWPGWRRGWPGRSSGSPAEPRAPPRPGLSHVMPFLPEDAAGIAGSAGLTDRQPYCLLGGGAPQIHMCRSGVINLQ